MASIKKYIAISTLGTLGIWLLASTGVVFYALLFAGCTSLGLSSIYLLQLSSNGSTSTDPILRINLFGICLSRPPLESCWTLGQDLANADVRMDSFFFAPENASLPAANPAAATVQDGKGVLSYALSLQRMVAFSWVTVASSLFFTIGLGVFAYSAHSHHQQTQQTTTSDSGRRISILGLASAKHQQRARPQQSTRSKARGGLRILTYISLWLALVLSFVNTLASVFATRTLALTSSVGLMIVAVSPGTLGYAMMWVIVAVNLSMVVGVLSWYAWERVRDIDVLTGVAMNGDSQIESVDRTGA